MNILNEYLISFNRKNKTNFKFKWITPDFKFHLFYRILLENFYSNSKVDIDKLFLFVDSNTESTLKGIVCLIIRIIDVEE